MINDGNGIDWNPPIKYNQLNEDNTDMYVGGKLEKFQRFLFNPKKIDEKDEEIIDNYPNLEVKYVFDHKLKHLNYMFFACDNITGIKFVNVDTSDVKEMKFTFSDCHGLTYLDMKCFNTKNLKSIYNCFFLSGIEEIDLSNFNFENIDEKKIDSFGLVFGRSCCKKLILSKRHDKIKMSKIFFTIETIIYI